MGDTIKLMFLEQKDPEKVKQKSNRLNHETMYET